MAPRQTTIFGLINKSLGVQPGVTRCDLGSSGFLVDAALASFFELEMLDDVGKVDVRPVNAGVGKGTVQQFSSGADEGMTLDVFFVAGFLADKDQVGMGWAFAKDGLRCIAVQIAAPAMLHGLPEFGQGWALGDERGGAGGLQRHS